MNWSLKTALKPERKSL